VTAGDIGDQLTDWFAGQLPGAEKVRIDNIDQVAFGHSAEMMLLALSWRAGGEDRHQDVVLRARPELPWLLEPYDLRLQFDILRALEGTAVRAPRALWIEESGTVLGRQFYVMERLAGTVYEQCVPAALKQAPQRVRRMAERAIEQIAAIHRTDLRATGLDRLGDGRDYLDRELDRWDRQVTRWQFEPVPGLARLSAELRARQPARSSRATLVHGNPKGGNFAFTGDEVTGVFDWEMSAIGDPMADIGWAEVTWRSTLPFSMLSAPDITQLLARYQDLTGVRVHHRPWHRAMQAYKMAVIMLTGTMLFRGGFTSDTRFAAMGAYGPPVTAQALRELDPDLKASDLEAGWPDYRSSRNST
jgi:aminoglycoside phosphotransferase (APT) family kinase protein